MSNIKEKPYIGVTGLDQPREAEAVTRTFEHMDLTKPDGNRIGMIGLLVSERRLSFPDRERSRHPSLSTIRRIFETTQGKTFNTLHYNTYHEDNLSEQIEKLLGNTQLYTDKLCQGIQLNVRWPNVDAIKRTKELFPDLKVILQLGPNVLTSTPQQIAANLTPYIGEIDYALIDPSGGRNLITQVNTVAPVYNEIREIYPDLALVFAGGFRAGNVGKRLWLLFQMVGTTDFGTDAESGLRLQSRQNDSPTPFSVDKAHRYIRNSALFFKSSKK